MQYRMSSGGNRCSGVVINPIEVVVKVDVMVGIEDSSSLSNSRSSGSRSCWCNCAMQCGPVQ